LYELRKIVVDLEEQRDVNRRWLKSRRPHVDHSGCERLIQQFHLDRRIAESLTGSMAKAERLRIVRATDDFEVFEDNFFGGESRFKVSLDGKACSCGKLATVGLPCSHIFRILSEIEGTENLKELIHPRWVLSDEEYCVAQTQHAITRLETLPKDVLNADMTVRQRFAASLASSQEAASVACRSQEAYDAYAAMIKQFMDDHMKPAGPKESNVRDLGGTRPGRKPLKRGRRIPGPAAGKTCAICGFPHTELKCRYLGDVRKYVRDSDGHGRGDTSTAGKHCSICGISGHYAPRCPAIQRYREYFTMMVSDDDTPPMPDDPEEFPPPVPAQPGNVDQGGQDQKTSASSDFSDHSDIGDTVSEGEELRRESETRGEEEDTVDLWELAKKAHTAKRIIEGEECRERARYAAQTEGLEVLTLCAGLKL
jgi:hypothetical protein